MEAKTFLAYFYDDNAAETALRSLQEKIFVVALKKYEAQLPDPDVSISSLMVGVLPDVAQGIFGVDENGENGAYLLIIVDECGHEDEIKSIVERFGGMIIKQEN